MNAAHDVDLQRSVVARVDGVPGGLVFLAVRGRRGWIGGMGVTPEARGRGLGRELMRAALGSAWDAHLTSVQLEVIEENRWAIAIYEEVEFRDRRRLEVWVRPPAALPAASGLPAAGRVDPARWLATLERRPGLPRPWQREPVMLERAAGLEVFGAEDGGESAGIALRADGAGAAILDAAAARAAPAGALESALRAAIAAHPDAGFTLLNLPANDPAKGPLERLGFTARFRQREMLRRRR